MPNILINQIIFKLEKETERERQDEINARAEELAAEKFGGKEHEENSVVVDEAAEVPEAAINDLERKRKVNRKAVEALKKEVKLSEEQAVAALTAIVKGKIPAVQISYA